MKYKNIKNLDLYKWILIIIVIIWHVIPYSLNESILRYIIYIFHMPLFIWISGFLIKKYFLRPNIYILFIKYNFYNNTLYINIFFK